MAWNALRTQSESNAQQQFELHIRDVIDSIEDRLRQHEQILLGGAGLFDASSSVDRAEWRAYIDRLNLKENYPGIEGVGFSRIIKPADLQAHILAMRKEGYPNYAVRPSGERPVYTSIIYLEPFTGRNLVAFGYDMMSEVTRAKAMRVAAATGKTAISAKVKLVQETHGKAQAGFLMYVPVYRRGQPASTPDERWTALEGFIFSPYRVDDLMAGILGIRVPMVDFAIFDGENETEDGRMFSSTDASTGSIRGGPKMTSLRTISAYGHTWSVRLQSTPKFEAGFQSPLNVAILALGGGISALLFLLTSFLISRREQAEQMAEQMTRDIRTNQEKLRQSEARIHAIVEGAEHLIITTDTDGLIQSFNRSAENHLGYLAGELVGKLTPAAFHDSVEVERRARELFAAGTPVEPGFEVFAARARQLFGGDTHEWTYIRKDGSRFPVSLTITALRDGQGEINAFLGIATDITERKHAEAELRKLSLAIEQSPVSVMIANAKGNIEYVNTKFFEVTGYTPHEVMGRNPRMLQSGLTPGEVYQSMWETILSGREWRGMLQNRKKNGDLFWEEIYISAILDGNGKIANFVAVKEDITERLKVERMKREFISTVSHELRTPLTSIRGSLALIVGGVAGDLPAAAKPLVDIAHRNSERLILLVNDILDMEKIEAGKMEFDIRPAGLMDLLKQALEANRAYAEQFNVGYELENELPDAMVNVDANRLLQVFANLLSNAAKFSFTGGTVRIGVERIGQRIRVAVKDNGPGIPEEFRDRIFEKFAQADSSDTRKKGGTGLGLSITKAIVEQMGGSIGFDSQPNVLTTFYVEFPEAPKG
ncbi:MAG: CHASE domain-containing protein [Sulfuritalea sp.]|jgi:PAS domain S-box-containing protein|nr:CHASE domain-containing protein [Sulfuritalea sp.]